jgi:Fis family transcriptional regulator, factor for inversion stimulation protein
MATTASSRASMRAERAKPSPATLGNPAGTLRRMRRNESMAATLASVVSREARRGTAGDAPQGKAAPRIEPGAETLEQCVCRSLDQYFVALDGAKPHALHDMVLQAVERPLFRFAMDKSRGNQSAAALLLGINRNTLRKKLAEYGLMNGSA